MNVNYKHTEDCKYRVVTVYEDPVRIASIFSEPGEKYHYGKRVEKVLNEYYAKGFELHSIELLPIDTNGYLLVLEKKQDINTHI